MADIEVLSGVTSTGCVLDENNKNMFVSLGGTAVNTTINDGGLLNVYQGATANNTTVNWGGNMRVEKGGTATSAVLSHGYAHLYGTFNSASLINMGYIAVSGGIANHISISSAGYMSVSSGGTANSTTVNANGFLFLHTDATADSVMISSGGQLVVSGGKLLKDATVYSGGTAIVKSPTKFSNFVVRGKLQVESGGVMSQSIIDLTVLSGGEVTISGGTVDGADVKSGASVTVEKDGFLGTAGISSANVTAKSEAILDGVFLDSGSILNVSSGAVLRDICVSSGAVLTGVLRNASDLVFSGGTLDLNIAKASEEDGYLVDGDSYSAMDGLSSVTLSIANKQMNGTYKLIQTATGFDKTITVKFGGNQLGTLTVNGGPTEVGNITCDLKFSVNNLVVTVTGGAIPDPIYSGATLINERKNITSGMSAIDINVTYGGELYIHSGGIASNTEVYHNGEFRVFSGGKLRGATVHSGGTATVGEDVMASNVIVDGGTLVLAGGWAYQTSKGNAVSSNTIVRNNGRLLIGENGYAIGAIVSAGGRVDVSSDAHFESATVTFADVFAYEGAIVSRVDLKDGGVLNVKSGGSAQHINVSAGGVLTGILRDASELRFYGGALDLNISDAAPENEFLIDEQSFMRISMDETSLYSITVKDDQAYGTYQLIEGAYDFDGTITVKNTLGQELGTLTIEGGTAEIGGASYTLNLSDDYHLTVTIEEESGGNFTGDLVSATKNISSGKVAGDVKVGLEGRLNILAGGVAYNVELHDEGQMHISSGGIAFDTLVNKNAALLTVSEGGVARNVVVSSGGRLDVCAGGKLTGFMKFEENGKYYASSGAIFDFDITGLAADDDESVLVDFLSPVSDLAFNFTLTVSDTQANGKYYLANGAYGFDTLITPETPLTVKNTNGLTLATIFSVGSTTETFDMRFTLNLSDDNHLTVTVEEGIPLPPEPPEPPEPTPADDILFFTGDFDGDGKAMLATQKDGAVRIYANGAEWGNGLALDPGWEVVGTGDFNADKKDDFLRVNTEGYVVGEMSQGDGTFAAQVLNLKSAGWSILGTGDFNGNGSDDVLIANPTAASETVGLLGYWESGVTWTLINGYSAEWEMVSCGDFNGDGKCDMLWRNSFVGAGDLTYNAYCTWIVEDPVDWRMVSVANPDEWNFLCSGDFDGDKMNDIAMINDVGVVGIWGVNDGYLSSWSILSAVTAEWTLAGVADFNGDGTDDIAWSNTDTGLTGYWQINDKTLTTWANIATLQAV